ncbi:MAG: hypothetical protein IJT62_01185 [Oscillospiraceae bacterium]|nr:hypothetical protein [Oscillospiraceae bacterium]
MKESWDNIFGEVPASFEARVSQTLASLEETPKVVRFRFPAGSLIAAVLAVAVLAGTALATGFFGMKNLTVADPYATPEASGDVIALQGVPESPEFRANAEWMDYLAGLDLVKAAADADAGITQIPEGYDFYRVFSQEMADKLQEIASRYALKLHTGLTAFYSQQELCTRLNTQPFITNCSSFSGYVYEDGSFQGDGVSTAGRSYEYQLGRYVKGTFSEVTLNVGNAGEYEEWTYTTASGVNAQLFLGPERCVLLADLSDSFVAVNLLGGTDGNSIFMPDPVTREDLEAFADLIDFTGLN